MNVINQKVIQALLSNKDDEMVSFKISSNDGASSSIFSFGSYNEIHKNIKMVKTINLKTIFGGTILSEKSFVGRSKVFLELLPPHL